MPHSKKKIDKAIKNVNAKAESSARQGARDFMATLNELRQKVVLEIAQSGTLSPITAQAAKTRIADLTKQYQDKLSEQLSFNQRRLFVKGIQVVDEAVKSADLTLAVPYLSEQTLEQAKTFGAELITNLMADARSRIAQQIDLAVLGQKGVDETIKEIGRNLGSPSVFGTIARRANTVFRTEVNRMQNLATDERLRQVGKQLPGMGKEWLHSHVGTPRPGHLDLDGVVVGVGESFVLVGRSRRIYRPFGPHDPTLPAEETINCKCQLLPVVRQFAAQKGLAT